MKKTIHDGSRSYSVEIPNPEPGKGKHAKTLLQITRRHTRNEVLNALRKMSKGE